MDELATLETDLLAQIAAAADLAALEAIRVAALGRKGHITERMKTLGSLDAAERKARGQAFNETKERIAAALDARKSDLEAAAMDARLATETLDVTLPVRPEAAGRVHPVSQVIDEITAIFADMGFTVAEGPDIEDDFHNFAALNIPPEHPARQMHDTFYLPAGDDGDQNVLRTHTSPVQIRHMQAHPPPYRIIAPGRVYRCDSDQTHTPMFHQIEGLVIDRDVHMGHLKGCLEDFVRAIFGIPDLPFRFRPSHFPFTEPSAEMDIGCSRDGGELRIGGGGDWLEILGCGMVHPNVLEAAGVNAAEWQGFAFGLGIDRIAMLKYGIPDLRAFFDADVRWLRHYGFAPLDIPTLAGGLT
ncbi:MAG: phenylalanine--tRNA ligase subunit alpha [Proteobacteria bacterium]|nr:phenylalanine--tRNA ligase subunit alpha [Pseudomonadota bacterium]